MTQRKHNAGVANKINLKISVFVKDAFLIPEWQIKLVKK
jgi:hypothetical protein